MVDGEALLMMMVMILSKFPIPAGCQNGVSGSESRFLVVAAQRNSSLEIIEPPCVFRSEGICRRKKRSRQSPRRPHPLLAQPGLARTTKGCGPLMDPLCPVFWLYESSGKIGVLQYFS